MRRQPGDPGYLVASALSALLVAAAVVYGVVVWRRWRGAADGEL